MIIFFFFVDLNVLSCFEGLLRESKGPEFREKKKDVSVSLKKEEFCLRNEAFAFDY